MKISYNWIKEYIDLKESAEAAAAMLTAGGSEVKLIEKTGDDCIMDIEITPNRSDCLSYIGIAREISAVTGKKIKMPVLKAKSQKSSGKAPFTVEIKDKDLCPRYTARLIKGVKVAESPEWLKKKVASMGLRPVNNVVDITNYVLFELGQPMHAFDYDKIKGKTVIIRRAHAGEKITSIDNISRSLEKDMLVIADQERPIAIGGVMGGLDTEVMEGTTDVLLESAYFEPRSVRKTSFKLALISESSYRFERSVDPGMVATASDRASLLIADICGGKICEFVDKGTKPGKGKTISLRIGRLNKILNLNLKEGRVKKILAGLFLKISSSKKGVIKVVVPSFRQDLKYEVDLIEEVARIYGYDKIGITIPRIVPNPERKSIFWRAREKATNVFTSLGLSEVITYGLLGRQAINKVFGDSANTIAIKNPLSAEQELMRPSLIPGVLSAMSYNMNRGIRDLKIFEIGAAYYKNSGAEGRDKTGYYEKTNICIALTGLASDDWQRPRNNVTFFDIKGALDALSRELGLKDFTIVEKSSPLLIKGASSDILYDEKSIGKVGCLAGSIQDAFDLSQKVFLAEIDFDALIDSINLRRKFSDIPKFPSIKRDISLIASGDVSFKKITSVVKEQGGELVEKIELFDRYTGRQIPDGRQGLLFRIEYRDRTKTLTAQDVDKVHNAIRQSLVETLGVTLR